MKKNYFFYFILCTIFLFNFSITKSDTTLDLGKKIFLNKGNCATCHTLTDAGSNGQIGPNLDQIRPDKNRVISAMTNGIGVMPSYIGELSTEEINAVAVYVYESSK